MVCEEVEANKRAICIILKTNPSQPPIVSILLSSMATAVSQQERQPSLFYCLIHRWSKYVKTLIWAAQFVSLRAITDDHLMRYKVLHKDVGASHLAR